MEVNKKALNKVANLYLSVGIALIVLSGALLAYPQLPYIFNALEINTPDQEVENISQPIFKDQEKETIPVVEVAKILPPKDENISEVNKLIVPSIGINAEIIGGENSTKALYRGPWMVPDYANPESNYLDQTDRSIIIASHRFGYSSWSREKRDLISFYHLPETKVGNTVVIQWNQREYVYEIIDTDESDFIKPTSADLILYTCKYYNSDVRIFRFANLISINDLPVE